MTTPLGTDRNLLYGVFALELGLIKPPDLLDAMRAWASLGSRALSELLLARGHLTPDQNAEIVRHVEQRLPALPDTPGTVPFSPASARFERGLLHAHGGLGHVFYAQDRELERTVALKEIRPDRADHPAYQDRLVLEGQITGRLEHPGIVPVYGLGRYPDGRPYYAMRFIQGQSLEAAIRTFHAAPQARAEQALELRQLLTRFLAVCQAMAYAHSRNVIHRDLKPANIMLGRFGETLVVDWGIAKVLGGAGRPETELSPLPPVGRIGTAAGRAIGTPQYMSPEQADGRLDDISFPTDIYLLGGILHEILTGQPPHPTGVRQSVIPSPRTLRPDVSPELDAIVCRALQPLPADRHASAAELARAVEQWLADEPLAAYRWLVRGLEDQLQAAPDSASLRETLARHRGTLGLVLASMDRLPGAEELYRQAIADYRLLLAAGPDVRVQADLATTLAHLASALTRLHRGDEARAAQAEANALYDRLQARHPDEFQVHVPSLIEATLHGFNPAQTPLLEGTDDAIIVPPVESGTAAHESGTATLHPTNPLPIPEPQEVPALQDAVLHFEHRLTTVRLLARGGAGSIYLARDEVLGRDVILKVLHHGFAGSAERFQREARITAQLDHPSIVRVYGSGHLSTEGLPFILMGYVPGPTLSQATDRFFADAPPGTRYRAAEFRRLVLSFVDVCQALGHAHRRGILHRDPKPANIIFPDEGPGVIVDWGLAGFIGQREPPVSGAGLSDEVFVTQVGAVMGTPAYMSPEQARGDADLGPAADIFVLGASLFYLLTGRAPRQGGSLATMMKQVVSEAPPRPREVVREVPAALDAICARATALRPEDRFACARDLAAALVGWLA